MNSDKALAECRFPKSRYRLLGCVGALDLCIVAKPNVPLVRLPEKLNFFLCGGYVLIFLKRGNVVRLAILINSKVISFVCCSPPVKMFGRVG